MGDAISQSTALKRIDISGIHFSVVAITALFCGDERTFHCPLEELNFEYTQLGSSGIAATIPFLKSISNLKYLHLNNNGLDNEAARLLSEALDHDVCIECLNLDTNAIGDEGVEHLLSAENSVHLNELSLEGNPFERRGFEVISHFLRRDDTMLYKLFVDCTDTECVQMLVESVSSNSKLEILGGNVGVFGTDNDSIMLISQSVQNLVCNLSSFQSLCQSNHQLSYAGINTNKMTRSNPTLKVVNQSLHA